ncbi:MAG: FkbM family methyltransferase [Oscillatoriales cyanobacterium]|nr:MAG: FkbM family methyltransferase [Oscillatoriales cyanobacterium]
MVSDSATHPLVVTLTLYNEGRYSEALSCCQSFLQQQPNSAQGYQLLGNILAALQNPQALDAYWRAIQIDPHHPGSEVAHFRVAEVLKAQGQLSQSVEHYTAAMLANPAWVTDDLLVSGEKSAIEQLIVPGAIVFDIGAQVGRWTQTVFEAVPDAQLYVFEPVAENHQQLRSLWTSKPPQAQLQIECLAAGKQREQRTFYHYSESSEWGSLYRRNTEVEQQHGMSTPAEIAVQTISLDEYCAEHNIPKIDFLKIDTEGGELDVLQGAVDLLRSHRVGLIQFEYGGCWLDSGIQLATAFAQLMDSGYQLFKILPTGLLKLEQFTADLENYHWCNFLAVAPEWALSGIWSILPAGQGSAPFMSWSDVTLSQQRPQRSPASPFSTTIGARSDQATSIVSNVATPNPTITALEQLAASRPDIAQGAGWERYQQEFKTYVAAYQQSSEPGEFPQFTFYPCLEDNVPTTPIDPYYFYQDTWAARKIFEHRPKSLVDIGSTVLYAGIVSQIVPTKFVDIRPPNLKIPGFEVVAGSILNLPFADQSQEFVSSLCVVEHIGLGRYGDPILPDGTRKACAEIDRILTPGGSLLISVPVGPPCIAFNAHRIFSKAQLLNYFPGYQVLDEVHLTPEPMGSEVLSQIPVGGFVVWVAHLQKPGLTQLTTPATSQLTVASVEPNAPIQMNWDVPAEDDIAQQQGFLSQFIGSNSLVFDVGTNLGQKADLYLALGARVVCFEPNPDLVALLQEKYVELPQVAVVNRGVAQTAGQLQLNICSQATTISTFSQAWQQGRFAGEYQWDRQVTVETITLDQAIAHYGIPEFCKIDVEGFEFEVLMGLSQAIPAICFEFAFELLTSTQQCLDRLDQLGYRQFNFSRNSRAKFAFTDWVDHQTLLHQLEAAAEVDPLLWGDIYAKSAPIPSQSLSVNS